MQHQHWGQRAGENRAWQDHFLELGPRNPVERLSPKSFNFHFRNLLLAPGRSSTYLCFRVKKWCNGSYRGFDKGVFRNLFYHTELCFLDWFRDTILSPDLNYRVTWYMSWSPCYDCAEEVVNFLNEHQNVSLRIVASRLYLCEHEDEQGLRDLVEAGAQVDMMSPNDFEYCWDYFVYNQGTYFKFWKNVLRHYFILKQELDEILWV